MNELEHLRAENKETAIDPSAIPWRLLSKSPDVVALTN
jgi:hypothetical protein